MPEKFNLAQMLAEIKENDEAALEGTKSQVTQRDIQKLVYQQLGEMVPAGAPDTLEDDDRE